MTSRLIFEGLLTELSKVNAPSMLLSDFNYYINKAISLHINQRYNLYDVNQQTTDDLRVLKATAILTPYKSTTGAYKDLLDFGAGRSKLFSGTYEVSLPLDYLHMLNCICVYNVEKRFKCWDPGNYVLFAAKRLTSDSWSTIINDFYNRPRPERPYYFIHNVNKSENLPTNIYDVTDNSGTDQVSTSIRVLPINKGDFKPSEDFGLTGDGDDLDFLRLAKNGDCFAFLDKLGNLFYLVKQMNLSGNSYDGATLEKIKEDTSLYKILNSVEYTPLLELTVLTTDNTFPRKISLKNIKDISVVEKEAGVRYGNTSKVRCEIRYGNDDSVFKLVKVLVDYIKTPLEIRLTLEQVDLVEDTSLIMEFPDYECNEIINELVKLVMEATADPRLQTHMAVTLSIASPVQQLAQPTATRA